VRSQHEKTPEGWANFRIKNAAPIDIPDRMSYDLHIFFPHAEFPAQPWYELLESFRDGDCEVAFDSSEPAERGGVKNCSLVVGQSVLSIGVGAGGSSCAPTGTRWEVNLSTTMGRSVRALCIQFAIPYHALVFFPGVAVHDCQFHLGRSVEASSWSTPEGWLAYAERTMWRRLGSKQALVDLGLFHADGRIAF
jgi:hypothetical protein